MASASEESVLSDEFSEMVCAAPLPTASVSVPLSVSVAEIVLLYCEEVWARLLTTIVWLPATASDAAEVNSRTDSSELDPCFCDKTPSKSVKDWSEVDNVLRSVPIEVSAVSSD